MLRIFFLVFFYHQLAAANFLYFRLEGMESLFVLPDPGSFQSPLDEGASLSATTKTKLGRGVEILDSYKQSISSIPGFQESLPRQSLDLMKLARVEDSRALHLRPKVLILANRSYDQTPVEKNLYQQRIAKIQEKFGSQAEIVILPIAALAGMTSAEKKLWVQRFGREFTAAMLVGGADISPELYGETSSGARDSQLEIDRHELEFAKLWMDQKMKPIYGICRGMQMLSVALGFKLKQHIEDHGDGYFLQHPVLELTEEQSRELSAQMRKLSNSAESTLSQGSLSLAALVRRLILALPDRMRQVLSYHHQAVDWNSAPELHHEISISEIALDGTIEGIRSQSGLISGNQHHSEFEDGEELPEAFKRFLHKGLQIEKSRRLCHRTHSF